MLSRKCLVQSMLTVGCTTRRRWYFVWMQQVNRMNTEAWRIWRELGYLHLIISSCPPLLSPPPLSCFASSPFCQVHLHILSSTPSFIPLFLVIFATIYFQIKKKKRGGEGRGNLISYRVEECFVIWNTCIHFLASLSSRKGRVRFFPHHHHLGNFNVRHTFPRFFKVAVIGNGKSNKLLP